MFRIVSQFFYIYGFVRRNHRRINRRQLRDTQNPFTIPDELFISYFRLNKVIVQDLISKLEKHARQPRNTNSIPFRLRLLSTLYFLAHGSYQGPTGNFAWCCASQSSVSRAIGEICELITDHLMPVFIKFPTSKEEKDNVKRGFYEKWGMKGIIGAVGGTHVAIIAPPMTNIEEPPFVYINSKGFHSINVMLIVDSDCRILAVDTRFPGSVHDSEIWQKSSIRQLLASQYEEGERHSYLIGDSGYVLEPWLLTPYPSVQNESPESAYNDILESAVRNVIGRTSGELRTRFRCLSKQRVLHYSPLKAGNIINACCILHNIAINHRLSIDCEQENLDDLVENEINDGADIVDNHVGVDVRDDYVRQYFG